MNAALRLRSQAHRLLIAYARAEADGDLGLIDSDAAALAGLYGLASCCWWRRCSELRAARLIAPIGATMCDRITGCPREMCAITSAGRAELVRLAA